MNVNIVALHACKLCEKIQLRVSLVKQTIIFDLPPHCQCDITVCDLGDGTVSMLDERECCKVVDLLSQRYQYIRPRALIVNDDPFCPILPHFAVFYADGCSGGL